MGIEGLGEFIKKVSTDSDFKQAFLSHPNKVMEKFGLSKEARGAILSIGVGAIAGATDVTQILAKTDPNSLWFAPIPSTAA